MPAAPNRSALRALTATVALLAVISPAPAEAGGGERWYRDPYTGHTYVYVPGQWTQKQAWIVAQARGGYPVVFSSRDEHRRVTRALDFRAIAPAHTGHFQLYYGFEPGLGWTTYTGERSAALSNIFNSGGPDDGVHYKWGWQEIENGYQVFYGPSQGKDEDAAVIWHDADGRLEDVSANHRGGVVIEYNW